MDGLIICLLVVIIALQVFFRPRKDHSDIAGELKRLLDEIQSAKPPVHLFKTKRFYFEVLFQNEASLLEQNQTAFKWTSNPI